VPLRPTKILLKSHREKYEVPGAAQRREPKPMVPNRGRWREFRRERWPTQFLWTKQRQSLWTVSQ
jgi:hypothetical protein